uniref:Reverse transcriptase zinc-binding domain-containing protein n=1 Tax=Fagus sylvatica TaxID=28930 RepID=A0A2N9F873_FAGSY
MPVVKEDKPVSSRKSKGLKRNKGGENLKKTKFEEYLEMGMQNNNNVASAEEDLELERKLAKKLKVKGGKLRGDDDCINLLFEGIPSLEEEEQQLSIVEEFSESKKRKKNKKKNEETCDVDMSEQVPAEASSRKKKKRKQGQEDDMEVDATKPVESCGTGEELEVPAVKGGGRYIAPHLRARAGNESEEYTQIRRRVRGLLNRLSESNVESITGEISNILHSIARSAASQIIGEEVLASCSGGPRGNEQYAAVFGAFVAGMACLNGTDFSAKLMASHAKCFEIGHEMSASSLGVITQAMEWVIQLNCGRRVVFPDFLPSSWPKFWDFSSWCVPQTHRMQGLRPLLLPIDSGLSKHIDSSPNSIEDLEVATLGFYQNPPSEWVLGQLKEFRKGVGASYEGYEEEIIAILQKIESRRPQQRVRVPSHNRGRSNGDAGGILLMWDMRVVEKVDEAVGNYSLSCKFRNVADQFEWIFSGAYGLNLDSERGLLWEGLVGLISWWDAPWCIGGGFNVVCFPSEKSDPDAIKTQILGFFQHLYTEDTNYRPLLDGLPFSSISLAFSSISTEEAKWLERSFEEEEVFNVVSNMSGDKALGPDGFPMTFFHTCWPIIKDDMLVVFLEFHEYGSFERSLNATFLTLIPKKTNAVEIKGRYSWSDMSRRSFLRALGVFSKEIPSPRFLFVIVMEALSRMMSRAVEGGLLLEFKTKFWTDTWCGTCSLKDAYPKRFRIARNKEASVGDHICYQNEVVSWVPNFTPHAQDWELESISSFLELLYSSSTKGHGEDRMCLNGSSKDGFQVTAYYEVLLPTAGTEVPWKSIWKTKAPPPVAFFVWAAALGQILTTDKLRRRDVIVLDWCCMSFLVSNGLCHVGCWIFYPAGVNVAEVSGLGRFGI